MTLNMCIVVVVTVSVYSEEGTTMPTATSTALSMKLKKEESGKNVSFKNLINISPDARRKNDQPGVFYFR